MLQRACGVPPFVLKPSSCLSSVATRTLGGVIVTSTVPESRLKFSFFEVVAPSMQSSLASLLASAALVRGALSASLVGNWTMAGNGTSPDQAVSVSPFSCLILIHTLPLSTLGVLLTVSPC